MLGEGLLVCAVTLGTACQMSQKVEPSAATKSRPDAERFLGHFQSVDGTSYLMAPINSRNGKADYGYDSGRNVHNYVFFNGEDESTLKLLPDNDCLFVAITSLPEKREGDKEARQVQWYLYQIIEADTNGDEELSDKDRRSLAVSNAGGAGFKEVITDVEHVYGQGLHNDTLLIIYRKNSKKYVTKISLPNREAVSTTELPTFGVAE